MVGFNGLSIGLSFLNTTVLLNFVGRAGYGEIYALTMVTQLVTIFLGGWTTQTISRKGIEELQSTGQIRWTFWSIVAIVFGAFVLTFSLSPLWIRPLLDYLSAPRAGVPFVVSYVPLQILWVQIRCALPVTGQQRLIYPLACVERMFILGTTVVLWWSGHLSISSVLVGYVFGTLVIDAVALWFMAGMIGRPFLPDWEKTKSAMNHGAPMLPSVWSNLLATNTMDALFVKRYMGAAELGVYALGVQIAGMAQQMAIVGSQLLTPRIIRWHLNRENDRIRRYVHHQFVPMLWAWCALGLISASMIGFWGPDFIPEKYLLLARLVWPLTVSTALMPLWTMVWAPLIVAFDRLYMFMFAALISGLVNLVMNLVLIPRFGSVGSVWATVLSLVSCCAVAELVVRLRGDEFPPRGWRFYLPPVLTGIIALAISVRTI